MIDPDIEKLILTAIAEDIRTGDITTNTLISETTETGARIIMKEAGVAAGLPFLPILFSKIDPSVEVSFVVQEGSYQKAGTIIAALRGPARAILSGERIALTLISHTSGIATLTQEYVREIAGLPCKILDTRKTLPGLRALEKYAVRIGGGFNHRFGLDDHIVIKTNHNIFLKTLSTRPIYDAARKIEQKHPEETFEIEIDDIKFLPEALETKASAILLINMTPKEITKMVPLIHKAKKQAYINNGGSITLDTVRAYASTGVNGICIDDLTSAPSLHISLRIS